MVRQQEFGFCDGLRGLAMISVFAIHGFKRLNSSGFAHNLYDLWWPVALPLAGDLGVDIFFVLSGFLIGGALYREVNKTGKIVIGKFLIRRAFRIFPTLFSSLLLIMAIEWAAGMEQKSCPFPKWYMYLFVWNNNLGSGHTECLGYTWSVALELQMYIASPLLFLLALAAHKHLPCNKFTIRRCMTAICVLGWVVCLVERLWYLLANGYVSTDEEMWFFYYNSPHRFAPYMAGLVAGMEVQALKDEGSLAVSGSWLANVTRAMALVMIASTCYFTENPTMKMRMFTDGPVGQRPLAAVLRTAFWRPVFGVAVASLMVLCARGLAPRTTRFLACRPLRIAAALSYSMYLLQFVGGFVLDFAYQKALSHGLDSAPLWLAALATYSGILLMLLATLPVAILNYALVERAGILAGKYCIEFLYPSKASSETKQLAAKKHGADLEAGTDKELADASSTDVTEGSETAVAESPALVLPVQDGSDIVSAPVSV
jgi:peptidoglycan/LPS O-acetylase OafA/YrhL